jgi:hypothetical protein
MVLAHPLARPRVSRVVGSRRESSHLMPGSDDDELVPDMVRFRSGKSTSSMLPGLPFFSDT